MLDACERAFRALLRLYPAPFRQRFEPEMLEFFRIRARRASGVRGRLRFVGGTMADWARSVLREHSRALAGRMKRDPHRSSPKPGHALLTDLGYAWRLLLRNRGFTAMAGLTLALGIGATVAVFSLAHAMFLAPLPFPDADRLVSVWETRGAGSDATLSLSGHEFAALKEQNRVFDSAALYRNEIVHLNGTGGDPEAITVIRASADVFRTLKLNAAAGRVFRDGEDGPGGARVAVLSDAFWRRRFGGDRGIVGRTIMLNDAAVTVIGVMPPLPSSLSPDAWLPMDLPAAIRAVGRHNLQAIARLAPGVTHQQAQTDADAIAARLARAMPRDNTDHGLSLVALREAIAGDFRTAVRTLLAAVGCVLLIGCANVANLLLTRGAGRQKEIAVRMALGATRLRIVSQLLAESVMLAAVGGAAGLLLATWIVDLVPTLSAAHMPLAETARIDWSVLLVAIALSIFTGLAAGLAPAMRSSRAHPESLREGTRVSDDREHRRLRSTLVAAEVAVTLVLLVGAGLLINTFVRLLSVNPGFDIANVLVVGVDLPASRYPEAGRRREFVDRVVTGALALPGAQAAGATSHLPLGGADNWMRFAIEGRPAASPGQEPNAAFRVVTTGYFRALGIPLRAGRLFADSDARLSVPVIRWFPQQPTPAGFDKPQAAPVALVSEAAARQFWPGEDPIGRQIRVLFSPVMTIIGIVGDVRHNGLNTPASPQVYLPHSQEPWGSVSVVVRTSGSPDQIAGAAREQLRALDPALPVSVRTMEEVLDASVVQPRFYAVLIAVFGAVAAGLAVVGIFGVISYSAAQRTREIGVRIALGAQRREILQLMIGQGMRPIAIGLVAGAAGAFYLTRFIETLLFGIEPTDPLTFVGVALMLAAIALMACWIPARRATRIDPVKTLRTE